MRIRCFLPEIRGPRTLRAVAGDAGINPGELSRIEQGFALPKDEDVPALQAAYGAPVTDWYPPMALLAVEFDDAALEALRGRIHEAWRRST